MELTTHFLFNLILIIIILFFNYVWVERLEDHRKIRFITLTSFLLMFVVCALFSYPMDIEMLLDLRNIPFIIGSLYLGISPFIFALGAILMGPHVSILGESFLILFYCGMAFVFHRMLPLFFKKTVWQRVGLSSSIAFLVGIIQTYCAITFASASNHMDILFAHLLIQPIGAAIVAYIMEEMNHASLLRSQSRKTARLKTVEQMAAGISHEIRNPLTAASGFSQLLQDSSLSDETQRLYLSILKSELYSAEKVINHYLNHASHPDSHGHILVQNELKQAMDSLQPLADRNAIRMISYLPGTSWIAGDTQKFHQCFVNVIKNAIEAMPEGGILRVEAAESGTDVVITIRDTGKGMTPEQLTRLGEPYYSTKGENGTGLGMMVSFQIVNAMNGNLKAESELGEGTIFTFSFPVVHDNFDLQEEEHLVS